MIRWESGSFVSLRTRAKALSEVSERRKPMATWTLLFTTLAFGVLSAPAAIAGAATGMPIRSCRLIRISATADHVRPAADALRSPAMPSRINACRFARSPRIDGCIDGNGGCQRNSRNVAAVRLSPSPKIVCLAVHRTALQKRNALRRFSRRRACAPASCAGFPW